MKLLISYFIISISILMIFLNNPLSMGLMILIQTLMICLISGMLIKTYWFAYILFLTFLGGLLVLFIYVSSIASNEMFKFSIIYLFAYIMLTLISIITSFWLNNNLYFMNMFMNYEMNNFLNNFIFINNEYKINLSKLYNNQTFMMLMLMIIYLFITLIAVVKITNIFFGPLRSSFYN